MKKRRTFDASFKARLALEALKKDAAVQDVARQHDVHPNQVRAWKKTVLENAARLFERGASLAVADERNMRAEIGRLTSERNLLAAEARSTSLSERRAMVDRRSEVVSVRRQCELLRVARSGVYRPERERSLEDLALIRRISELNREFPVLGSRRVQQELEREGRPVNRKRVQRILRSMRSNSGAVS